MNKYDSQVFISGICIGILGNIVATSMWELGNPKSAMTSSQGIMALGAMAFLGFIIYALQKNSVN